MGMNNSDNDAKHTGGCRCGAVRYAAVGAPHATSLCHCRSCQRSSGAHALAWVIFQENRVTITRGKAAIHESSPGVERGFCSACGTSLTYWRQNRPGFFDFTTVSLDDPDALPPSKEIWTCQRLAWAKGVPELPQFEEFSRPS